MTVPPVITVIVSGSNSPATIQVFESSSISVNSYQSSSISVGNHTQIAAYASRAGSSDSVETASYAQFAQTLLGTVQSASWAATASFAQNVTNADWNTILNVPNNIVSSSTQLPANIISSSIQLSGSSIQGRFTGSISGSIIGSSSYASTSSVSSFSITASYAFNGGSGVADWNTIINKPNNLISGSIQLSGSSFEGRHSGSFTGSLIGSSSYSTTAGSSNWNTLTNRPIGIISSSVQLSGSSLEGRHSGSFTGSLIGSSSYALTSSFSLLAATASYFSGTINYPSGLIVTGSVTASSYSGTLSYSFLTNIPSGIISSSTQLSGSSIQGRLTGSFTGSVIGSSSYAETSSYALTNMAFRNISSITSSTLAFQAYQTGSTRISKTFIPMIVSTSHPARIRLYSRPQERDIDIFREIDVNPTGSHGVIFDVLTTTDMLIVRLAPMTIGASLETNVTNSIAYTINSYNSASVAISGSITYLSIES